MIEQDKYESIKEKILKLQKLVEQGSEGEARNACIAIERLIERYGLSLDEILQDEQPKERFWIVKTTNEKRLFTQCLGVVLDTWRPEVLSYGKGTHIGAKLTKLQYIELDSMFRWYQSTMNNDWKEIQNSFVDAFISKHHLYPTETEAGAHSKSVDTKKLMRLMSLMGSMSDDKYHKQLKA